MNCRPVNAKEIARRSFEHAYRIEDVLAMSLVEAANAGIQEQVAHGHLAYAFSIPPFLYGYPCFDAAYVARKVRRAYRDQGFGVEGEGLDVRLQWGRDDETEFSLQTPAAAPAAIAPPPPPPSSSPAPVLQLTAPPPPPSRPPPSRPPPPSAAPVMRTITLDPLTFPSSSSSSSSSRGRSTRGGATAAGRGRP